MNYKLPPLPTFEEWCRIISPSEPGTQIASVENFVKAYAIAAIDAQGVPDVDDLRDRLVAISSAVAEQNDMLAQALMGDTLAMLASAQPAPKAKPQPLSSERDARIAELERELSAARKDAERYRWLRQHQLLAKIHYMPTTPISGLDEAIDAAMKGQQ